MNTLIFTDWKKRETENFQIANREQGIKLLALIARSLSYEADPETKGRFEAPTAVKTDCVTWELFEPPEVEK